MASESSPGVGCSSTPSPCAKRRTSSDRRSPANEPGAVGDPTRSARRDLLVQQFDVRFQLELQLQTVLMRLSAQTGSCTGHLLLGGSVYFIEGRSLVSFMRLSGSPLSAHSTAIGLVVNGRIRRKFPQGLDHSIARICGRHLDLIVAPIVSDAVTFVSESCGQP